MIAMPNEPGPSWSHGHKSDPITVGQIRACRIVDDMRWRQCLADMPEAVATVAVMLHQPPFGVDIVDIHNQVDRVFSWWMITHYEQAISGHMTADRSSADGGSALVAVMLTPDDDREMGDLAPFDIFTNLMPASQVREMPTVPATIWEGLPIDTMPASHRLVVFVVPKLLQSCSLVVDLGGDR